MKDLLKMEICMEMGLSNGTMARFIKDSLKEDNFMEMELSIILMDKKFQEFGIKDKIYI